MLAALLPGAAEGQEAAEIWALERRCGVQVVPEGEVETAIRSIAGYDITAAPNTGRFVAELLLTLADDRRRRRPDGPPLLLRQQEFFPAFLRVTGLAAEEAPAIFRKGRELGQVMVVEYRRDRVVDRVMEGPEPLQALSVRAVWPDTGGLPASYTYEDTLSDPHVRLREERNVTYRLLEFLDVVAYDELDGVSGRPTSGPLGVLFDVIGMAEFSETRFVMAGEGSQVTFTRVKKFLSFGAVATVTREGHATQGIPEDRPGYERLRRKVERDFEILYDGEPPPMCPGEGG